MANQRQQAVLSPTVFKQINAAVTTTVVWTPASGKKWVLMGYHLVVNTTAAPQLVLTDTSTTPVGPVILPGAAVGSPIASPAFGTITSGAANNTLVLTFTGGGTVSGYIYGVEQ